MKSALRLLFNVFWVLLVGISAAISNFFLGIACCLTVIGIPFGLQYFKFIRLVFAPAGKMVVTRFMKHPVMNVVWLLLGGLATSILYLCLGIVLTLTIIGWPLAAQLFKIARFNFAPFGCVILSDGEYTPDRNTEYDYDLLTRRIAGNPDLVIGKNDDGSSKTVAEYIKERSSLLGIVITKQQKAVQTKTRILIFALTAFVFSCMFILDKIIGYDGVGQSLLTFGICMILTFAFSTVLSACMSGTCPEVRHFYDTEMKFLMAYYPKGSPEKSHSGIGVALNRYIDTTAYFAARDSLQTK